MSDSPYEARSVLKTLWWLVLLRGILAILFGIAVLAWPKATVVVFVVLFAVFSLLDGILDIVLGVQAKGERGRWLIFLQGALAIIAGIIAVFWPSITAIVLLWLVALWAILSGVMEIAGSLELRRLGRPRWWWHTVAGALAIVLGAILLFGNPTRGILAILWAVGVLSIASGIALIIAAMIARRGINELYRATEEDSQPAT
ncbi:MAG TPA: HdeD family acid-resistance protein [Intrasporangium sp.]|uniref:HdeD family acid-resistance protein n=1 Tax=Intrasporangium sp. TaxID=1925024 RepID=UPI002F953FF0